MEKALFHRNFRLHRHTSCRRMEIVMTDIALREADSSLLFSSLLFPSPKLLSNADLMLCTALLIHLVGKQKAGNGVACIAGKLELNKRQPRSCQSCEMDGSRPSAGRTDWLRFDSIGFCLSEEQRRHNLADPVSFIHAHLASSQQACRDSPARHSPPRSSRFGICNRFFNA